MPSGYSGTPLVKKLGIKEGFRVGLEGAPAEFEALLELALLGRGLIGRIGAREHSVDVEPR